MDKDYFVHESSYVDEGCQIGKGTKIWHFSHIMSGCVIGESCNIGQNVVISPDVVLGRNCKIQNNVSVYTGVRCEDDVFLGPSMVFTNVINPRAAVSRKDEYEPTIIHRGASVGANATIVCGHELGEYCLIGAGSVVTKDVPAYALMVGNPARHIQTEFSTINTNVFQLICTERDNIFSSIIILCQTGYIITIHLSGQGIREVEFQISTPDVTTNFRFVPGHHSINTLRHVGYFTGE